MDLENKKMLLTDNCSILTSVIINEHNDFSGNDFAHCLADSIKYDYSFFKGCDFASIRFLNCSMNHIEFDESSFNNNCEMINCSLQSSDFIYNNFENVTFNNCNFDNGEWRESAFNNVTFTNCTFNSTTINLCTFSNCYFDELSAQSFHGTSKTFNLFILTDFHLFDIKFLESNFGLLGKQMIEGKINQPDNSSLFYDLSIMYYQNLLTNKIFIEKVLNILNAFSLQETKNFQVKIKFLSNIVIYTSKNNLSVFQMYYLSDLLYKGMSSIQNQLFLLEVMKMFTSLRSEISMKMNTIDKYASGFRDVNKSDDYRVEVYFEKSFSQEHIESFISAVCISTNTSRSDIQLLEYKIGSTYIDLMISKIIPVALLFHAINYLLPEVSVVLKNTQSIYIEYKELEKTITKYEQREAILKSLDKVQYIPLEKINETACNNLIEFDGKAQITM